MTRGGIAALLCGGVFSCGCIGVYIWQLSWVIREGTILSKSCHRSGGGDDGTFTACHVLVEYRTTDGETRTKTLDGVWLDEIHARQGHETVAMYFMDSNTGTVLPRAVLPDGVRIIVFVLCGSGLAAWFAFSSANRAANRAIIAREQAASARLAGRLAAGTPDEGSDDCGD